MELAEVYDEGGILDRAAALYKEFVGRAGGHLMNDVRRATRRIKELEAGSQRNRRQSINSTMIQIEISIINETLYESVIGVGKV